MMSNTDLAEENERLRRENKFLKDLNFKAECSADYWRNSCLAVAKKLMSFPLTETSTFFPDFLRSVSNKMGNKGGETGWETKQRR